MKPPKAPKITPPPPPPTINQAIIDTEKNDLAARRRGRGAGIFSNVMSRATGGVATKMMLGQGA